jgi:hypothetical protein
MTIGKHVQVRAWLDSHVLLAVRVWIDGLVKVHRVVLLLHTNICTVLEDAENNLESQIEFQCRLRRCQTRLSKLSTTTEDLWIAYF